MSADEYTYGSSYTDDIDGVEKGVFHRLEGPDGAVEQGEDGSPRSETLGYEWWRHETREEATSFKSMDSATMTQTQLCFSNVCYDVTDEDGSTKRILHNVSGIVEPGELCAIIGPSGAGKTSLLSLLGGRGKATSGAITYNGVLVDNVANGFIAYVLQEDYLFSELTVRQTLEFSAGMRMPRDMSKAQKKARVNLLIDDLLLSKAADTRVGNQFNKGLSGGEKKRTNIGTELLNNPSVVVLDEPTSGLDSATSLHLTLLLKRLASRGKTVLATLHQPSSQMYELFDKIIVMAEGRVAYFGPAQGVFDHFARINIFFPKHYCPSDYLLEIVTHMRDDVRTLIFEEQGKMFAAMCQERGICFDVNTGSKPGAAGAGAPPQIVAPIQETSGAAPVDESAIREHHYEARWFTQLWLLSVRAIRQYAGDVLSLLNFSEFSFLALVCSVVWWQIDKTDTALQDRIGLIFFVSIFLSFLPVLHLLQVFFLERSVLVRERASATYRLSSYFLSKTISEMPGSLAWPLSFFSVVYWTAGLNNHFGVFLACLGIMIVHVWTAQSVGLLIGIATKNMRQGLVVCATTLLTFMLIGGFYVRNDNLPAFVSSLSYVSFVKLTFESLAVTTIRGQTFACASGTPLGDFGTTCPVTESAIRDHYSFDLDPIWNVLINFVMGIVLRAIAFVALRYRVG